MLCTYGVDQYTRLLTPDKQPITALHVVVFGIFCDIHFWIKKHERHLAFIEYAAG